VFTGLIEHVGSVHSRRSTPAGERLAIDAPALGGCSAGESIAVDGVCLTLAAEPTNGLLVFDVVPQTLALTTLGSLAPGARVHLERAATPATLLGGHIVQGHVDGVGEVVSVTDRGEWRVRIAPGNGLMQYLAPRASVCVQGVSLTVAGLDPAAGCFEVALIPTTLAKTTLAGLTPGSRVNIECDAIAKQVVHWLRNYAHQPEAV